MSRETWVPLEKAILGKAAAEWVEWVETERENGARCLKCLKKFEIAHLIPVNCMPCWNELYAAGEKDAPVAVHGTISPDCE